MSTKKKLKIHRLDPSRTVYCHEMSTNPSSKLHHLTMGICREWQQSFGDNFQQIIPDSIKQMILEFGAAADEHTLFSIWITNHSHVEFKSRFEFEHIPNTIKSKLERDPPDRRWDRKHQFLRGKHALGGTSSNISTQDVIFLSETGFDSGVHEVVIHCLKAHPNDKIGIIENVDVDSMDQFGHQYLYHEMFGERYYWWKHTNKVWHQSSHHLSIGKQQWGPDDTIKMVIDCDNWTLQFFVKRAKEIEFTEMLGAFNIKKGIKYHPVLTHGDTKCLYMHILPKNCMCGAIDKKTVK